MDQHFSIRTTLDIEEDVLAAARELARREKKTAGQVISELARRRPRSSGSVFSESS
jgi:predicted DNA-binding ribbon-helix-helix protein